MSVKTNDTLYLAVGGLALLGTSVWAFLQQSDISEARTPLMPPASGTVYEPGAVELATLESKQWPQATSQKAGSEWLFDVFTPPVIYYDTQTKTFTVTPPVIPPPPKLEDPNTTVVVTAPKFGLELVKVFQPLFRLQLVGYIGEGASARGNFENQLTGEVIFGTTGKKLPDLNLEIVSFAADRRRIKVEGGTELVVTEAVATVRDTVTGVETKLDAKIRTPEGPPAVTFKNEFDGTEIVAKSGDVLNLGGYTFTIGALDQAKPSAVVTKAGGTLVAPEEKTLEIPPPPAPTAPANMEGINGEMPPPDGVFPSANQAPGSFPGF